jgi:hypothetical protein
MDWQLAVAGPAIFPLFWGLVRTPPEKRAPAQRAPIKNVERWYEAVCARPGYKKNIADIPVV